MSDPFDPRDLQVVFLREIHEARARAREALARAGRAAGDAGAVRDLRNFFHRLAGSAGTVGHGMLARLAGACELAADQELERKGPLSKLTARIFAEGLAGVDDVLETRTPDRGVLIPVLQQETGGSHVAVEDVPSRVLVIDDDLVTARATEAVLRAAGFLTARCCDPADAYEAILRERPDLVILDVLLGEVDGFEVCRRVRANAALQLVPIIFVTRRGEIEERVRGLQVGGNDYLAKPFDPPELVARVHSHLSRLSALCEMAIRDGLTRCYNNKYFKMRLEQELVRARRYGSALALGLLDVDHFKQVNDTHGHPGGDAVLAHLASLLIASVRSSDIVARYGGEEFAFVLVEAGLPEAKVVAERMRASVEAHEFEVPGGARLRATASIGIAAAHGNEPAAGLIQRADAALYEAKATGRNRVRTSAPPAAEPISPSAAQAVPVAPQKLVQ
jgi:diguanylate cyclase (GGDEF)-like protein